MFELLSNFLNQAPVVQKVDSAFQWINLLVCYPLDSDLSGG